MKNRQLWRKVFLFALVIMAAQGSAFSLRGQSTQKDNLAPPAENKPQLVVQLGHSGTVNSARFSPDGKYVLTASADGTSRLWETKSGREIRRFVGHSDGIKSAIFSSDGKYVLTAGRDKTARLWEVKSGREIRRFEGHSGSLESATFSPDGRWVLTASDDQTARLWETESGREVRRFEVHRGLVGSAIFSSDGKHVLTAGGDGTARLWEVESGRELRRFDDPIAWLTSATFSPDGRYVLTVSFSQTVRLWEIESEQEIRRFEAFGIVRSAIFSSDGKYVLIASRDGIARLWEVESGKEIRRFEGHSGSVASAIFSPDGKHVLTASGDKTARQWEVESGREVRRFEVHSGPVRLAIFSPDGKRVLTVSDDETARLWEIESKREVCRFERRSDSVNSATFSPDGKYVLTVGSDNTARLWETESGRQIRRFEDHSHSLKRAFFLDDGKHISTWGSDGRRPRKWEIESGQEIRQDEDQGEKPNVGMVYILIISSNEKHYLTANADGTASLYEIESHREIHRFREFGVVTSAMLSRDGKCVLTANADGTARLWEIESKREIRRFGGHLGWVNSATFSPDGKYVLTAGPNRTAKLWEIESEREVERFEGHSDLVNSAAFSPDGKYVLTSSRDGTTRFWSVSTGKELCQLISFRDGSWAVVDSNGHFDASDVEEVNKGLHWIMPDDPMKPLPIEIFMRDYYEPRLLPRLLNGEKFKEIRKLSELNRTQPPVKITGIERQKDNPDLVTIRVEVAKAKSERQRDEKNNLRETGVYDLRLFRDGQIVGQHSDGKPQALPQSVSNAEKLLAWRNEAQVKLDANGKRTIRFENIKLPHKADVKQVEFSAYAFNEDRVISKAVPKPFDIPADLVPRKGRAYIISVGVNAYENPSFDLKYSVNDANAIQKTIFDRLLKTGDYAEPDIVRVPLISDAKQVGNKREVIENTATKSNLKAALDLLAGRPVDAETKKQIPNADKLRQANPEDLVLISFSSHGYADNNGNFFFVLSDTGPGTGERITEALLQKLSPRFLSSEELSLWLRDVDAGEMLMIVDACHSAAAVAGKEFKPGPMGSRGLGQLSYDKGMRILTATQAADVAYGGIGETKQGLLTYVLVKDGIEAGKADFKPFDRRITVAEWLQYGEQGVPKLLEEASRKARQVDAPVELKNLVQRTLSDIKMQRPSLFDFSRKRADVVLVKP